MWCNENSGENERGKIPVGDRLAFPADSKSQEVMAVRTIQAALPPFQNALMALMFSMRLV